MARVRVRTAGTLDTRAWIAGAAGTETYFGAATDPIHLDVVSLEARETASIAGNEVDRLAYVWEGGVEAGGLSLEPGSSIIVEHGSAVNVTAGDTAARLVVFSANGREPRLRGGGHVHLLPRSRVPRVEARPGASTSGGLHANGRCATCELWLNENSLPGGGRPELGAASKGIHAHPEDEIIFVTEGGMFLGSRLVDRGTALAISAHTLYGFAPGPRGVTFITFRPTGTTGIRFAAGGDYVPSTFFDGLDPMSSATSLLRGAAAA